MKEHESIWPISDVPSQTISIYEGPDVFLTEFASASKQNQVLFAAYWFQAEVLNGGLHQFFNNDTGVLAPEAADAIRLLGLPKLAAAVDSAMQWFGKAYPRERALRQKALTRHGEGNDPFGSLEDLVVECIYEENGGLERSALAYIQNTGN
jgi:hypothetical protein